MFKALSINILSSKSRIMLFLYCLVGRPAWLADIVGPMMQKDLQKLIDKQKAFSVEFGKTLDLRC